MRSPPPHGRSEGGWRRRWWRCARRCVGEPRFILLGAAHAPERPDGSEPRGGTRPGPSFCARRSPASTRRSRGGPAIGRQARATWPSYVGPTGRGPGTWCSFDAVAPVSFFGLSGPTRATLVPRLAEVHVLMAPRPARTRREPWRSCRHARGSGRQCRPPRSNPTRRPTGALHGRVGQRRPSERCCPGGGGVRLSEYLGDLSSPEPPAVRRCKATGSVSRRRHRPRMPVATGAAVACPGAAGALARSRTGATMYNAAGGCGHRPVKASDVTR